MKKLLTALMIPFIICSCTQTKTADAAVTSSPDTVSRTEGSAKEQEAESSASRNMSLISITTSDPSAGTAFAEKPVNDYVARSIASWTPNYEMPPAPYYEKCSVKYTGTDGSVTEGEAEVKVRGNWTTNYEKKPLRIKFAEKQSLGDLAEGKAYKNWVLLASYKDLSLERDKAAFAMAEEILGKDGYYVSDCEFAEVEINGKYWGVYLLAEQQECNEGRVEVPEPSKGDESPYVGYFMEFDGYAKNEEPLSAFFPDYADNAPLTPFDGVGGSGRTIRPRAQKGEWRDETGITIKSDVYSAAQHDMAESFVNNCYDIMYYAAYEDKAYVMTEDLKDIKPADISPEEAVKAVVDVRSLADMYIMSEITCDADVYWSSFFMSADLSEGGKRKLTFEAPWDHDSSLGNRDRCTDGQGMYAANIVPDVNLFYETVNPWLAVLMNEEWFRDIIRDRWTEVYDSGIFEKTAQSIREDSRKYYTEFSANYDRWSNMKDKSAIEGELNKNTAALKNQTEAAEQLASWLETRVAYLNGYWHKQ